jgi:hypothetical protein
VKGGKVINPRRADWLVGLEVERRPLSTRHA